MSVLRSSHTLLRSARSSAAASQAFARFASTSAAAPSADSKPATPTGLPMTWTEYLDMRKKRKQWSTLTTIPSSIAGLVGGAGYLGTLDFDLSQSIMGLDPMLVFGGATIGFMALGYLVGPAIGNGLFSLTHPKYARGNPPPLEVMDREFFQRIRERRADPSRQSVNNPAPDFYGEKIVSLPTYRRWLKDQKAYERKASHGVPVEEL